MPAPVTFTLDVEDYPGPDGRPRAPRLTRQILEFLAGHSARGTFFVVGELADAHPDLVRDIAAGGHEVGLHAWRHLALPLLDRSTFAEETARGKAVIETITGRPVVGYRAPAFSIVPDTEWATDTLAELGFRYSSSVLPARNPLYGWPGQSRVPFRWPSGVAELPCPVTDLAGRGRATNPYLGGIYLRLLPWRIVQRGLAHARPDEVLWLYSHPYDFDPDEPFQQRPDLSRAKSRLQWINRRRMFARIERLLTFAGIGAPLAERIPSAHGTADA